MSEAGKAPRIDVVRLPHMAGVELQVGTAVTRTVPRHWHDEYHLSAHTGGCGQLCYAGTTYANPVGSLNLVAPGEIHSNAVRTPEGCDFLAMNFEPGLFRQAARALGCATDPAFSHPTTDDRETFQRFVRLHHLLTGSAEPLEQESAVQAFLASLLQRHTRSRAVSKPLGRERRAVRRVREYLAENYARQVRLSELASLTKLSPFHLARVFTREVGIPPHAFLKQVRLAHAKALLRKRLPIARVAAETGFADQSHLTRAFRELVGISPGAYRTQ